MPQQHPLWIVDRLEGPLAVCEGEGRASRRIPLAELPPGVREGDCLREAPDGYTLDPAETRQRRERARALFDKLKKR